MPKRLSSSFQEPSMKHLHPVKVELSNHLILKGHHLLPIEAQFLEPSHIEIGSKLESHPLHVEEPHVGLYQY